MSTTVLSDKGRVRSEQEWQNVALLASQELTEAVHDGAVGTAVYIGDWDKLQVIFDVTALATDAADTLDISIEMSMDNLAWYHVGDFTQILGNGSATTELMTFIPGSRPTNVDAIIIGSTAPGATVIREHLIGRWIRYTIAYIDADADSAFTVSLTASLMRNDTVRDAEAELKEIELYPLAIRTNETTVSPSDVWEIGDDWEFMQVVLRTTNHDTDAGDHLDVHIDMSVDGIDWYNVGMFTQCNGDDGPWVEIMTFIPGELPNNVDAILAITADAGETVIRPAFVGPFLRARNVITESGTDDETFTFALKAYVK